MTTFIELVYAQRVEGRHRRDELSTRGQVHGCRHGTTAPQEPKYTDVEQRQFLCLGQKITQGTDIETRDPNYIAQHVLYIETPSLWRRGGSWSYPWYGEVGCADSLSARRLPAEPLLPGIAAG